MSIKVVHRDRAFGLIVLKDEPKKQFYFEFFRQWFDNGNFNQEWQPMKGVKQTLRLSATSGVWQQNSMGLRFIGLGGIGTVFTAFPGVQSDILRHLAVASCDDPEVLKCDGLIANAYQDLRVALHAQAAADCAKILKV